MGVGSVTRPPVELIGSNRQGQVIAEGGRLKVSGGNNGNETDLSGYYDPTSGTLTLSVPNYPKLTVSGFLTKSSIPRNPVSTVGQRGRDGIDGTIGLDGRTGDTGCQGPRGPRGITGARGPRGERGLQGARGERGEKGERGSDGRVLVFVQDTDPGPVGAFAIWVRPV